MSKKRPMAQTAVRGESSPPTKMEASYWKERLFRNTFTYKGRRTKVNGWSVKIQLFGIRKTFSLRSSNRSKAAAEACRIYAAISMQGWEEAAWQRKAIIEDPSSSAINDKHLKPAGEFEAQYWRHRLIHRRYPEQVNPGAKQEFSARIEHAGTGRYFPLGTSNESKAAAEAMRIHKTVVQDGWAAITGKFSCELTLAMRWLENPIAWTYTTLHTHRNGEHPTSLTTPEGKPASHATIIIEPDVGLRSALTSATNSQEGFHCAATYAGFAEAERELTRLRVDFALVNWALPDRSGAAGLEELQRRKPGLVGLLYSVYEDSDELFKTTPGGATGYMLKRTPAHHIFDPLAETQGRMTRELVAPRIREYFQQLVAAMPSGPSALEVAKLTLREHEVLAILARGCVAKEVADTLGISVWTVHGHIKSIFEKLGVHSRTEAVVKFLQK